MEHFLQNSYFLRSKNGRIISMIFICLWCWDDQDEFSVWALANRVIANKLRLRMAVSKKPSTSSKRPLSKFFRFVAWHMSLFLVPGIWEARDLLKLTLMLKLVTMLVMKLKCRSCSISPVRKMKNATSGEPLRCPAPCFSDCKPQSERGEN